MKKTAQILISLIVLGFGSYFIYDHFKAEETKKYISTWKNFTPKSKLFEISLPNPPQYGKDFVEIPNSDKKRRYDLYASEKVDGTLFLVTVITYPFDHEIESSIDILDQNIQELMHSKENSQLNKLFQNVLDDRNYMDFNFESNGYSIEGRSIHDDHMVYMLTYISKKENVDEDEYEHFIHSFKILKSSEEVEKNTAA